MPLKCSKPADTCTPGLTADSKLICIFQKMGVDDAGDFAMHVFRPELATAMAVTALYQLYVMRLAFKH